MRPLRRPDGACRSPGRHVRLCGRSTHRTGVGGFRFLFSTFNDVWLEGQANEIASEFIRSKIRAIVKDPATADLLCPKYPLAAKRPPCGHGYYEAYNRNNVPLVDASENPIAEILPTGLRTATDVYEADIIIFATGFDAITGAADGIDIRGRDGRRLRDTWHGVPRSYIGLAVDGFPNLFTVAGPLGPFANGPTMVEEQVEFVTAAIKHIQEHGSVALEAIPDAGFLGAPCRGGNRRHGPGQGRISQLVVPGSEYSR